MLNTKSYDVKVVVQIFVWPRPDQCCERVIELGNIRYLDVGAYHNHPDQSHVFICNTFIVVAAKATYYGIK